jgi:hypothetical protein
LEEVLGEDVVKGLLFLNFGWDRDVLRWEMCMDAIEEEDIHYAVIAHHLSFFPFPFFFPSKPNAGSQGSKG